LSSYAELTDFGHLQIIGRHGAGESSTVPLKIRVPGFAGTKMRPPFPKAALVNSIARWQLTATGNSPATTLVARCVADFPANPFPNHPATARCPKTPRATELRYHCIPPRLPLHSDTKFGHSAEYSAELYGATKAPLHSPLSAPRRWKWNCFETELNQTENLMDGGIYHLHAPFNG
jgi:hypothetical protein